VGPPWPPHGGHRCPTACRCFGARGRSSGSRRGASGPLCLWVAGRPLPPRRAPVSFLKGGLALCLRAWARSVLPPLALWAASCLRCCRLPNLARAPAGRGSACLPRCAAARRAPWCAAVHNCGAACSAGSGPAARASGGALACHGVAFTPGRRGGCRATVSALFLPPLTFCGPLRCPRGQLSVAGLLP